jgi:hypothetical protein
MKVFNNCTIKLFNNFSFSMAEAFGIDSNNSFMALLSHFVSFVNLIHFYLQLSIVFI